MRTISERATAEQGESAAALKHAAFVHLCNDKTKLRDRICIEKLGDESLHRACKDCKPRRPEILVRQALAQVDDESEVPNHPALGRPLHWFCGHTSSHTDLVSFVVNTVVIPASTKC